MVTLNFDNRFVRELPGDSSTSNHPRQVQGAMWSPVMPTPVAAPKLLVYSSEMAAILDLTDDAMNQADTVAALGGNGLLPGMETYATCYGGHQFGQWAGQLGDGRAIYLGEVVNLAGQRWELQLKGAGPTPYSRRADGRAVMRSSVREFLCSEAMHHLGVPTTRALSLVGTGDKVVRDMFYDGNPQYEPGAIVCRVAPSFTRFGHFELSASRSDHALLKQVVDFTIARDFPQMKSDIPVYGAWFSEISARTARLMAQWMRVGFVHGVMNTDNMSILGLTIDYGPYGWLENFDPNWTPNTTDAQGRRYCFGRQPQIGRWNIERLGEALSSILSAEEISAGIAQYDAIYAADINAIMAAKFGFDVLTRDQASLIDDGFEIMHLAELDMTEFFRRLATIDETTPLASHFAPASYDAALFTQHTDTLNSWLQRYCSILREAGSNSGERMARMNQVNPRFVLRNYLAQQAIDKAEQGDVSLVDALLNAMRKPYDEQPEYAAFQAIRPDWARHKAGCSMLSCSS